MWLSMERQHNASSFLLRHSFSNSLWWQRQHYRLQFKGDTACASLNSKIEAVNLRGNNNFYSRLLFHFSVSSGLFFPQHRESLANRTTRVSTCYERHFQTRNRLHPWVSSDLTNGQEAEVSVAYCTWHSWIFSAVWAPSPHSITVERKKDKMTESGQEKILKKIKCRRDDVCGNKTLNKHVLLRLRRHSESVKSTSLTFI